MTFFIRAFLPALLLCAFAADAVHAQRWSRADTKHFVVYSDGSTKSLEKAATDLERLDALMRMLLGLKREANPHRIDVYIVDGQSRVADLAGRENVAGFYSPNSEGSFIVGHRARPEPGEISGQVVLFHEYTHHLMFRYFTNAYPAWYREGIAEYLSTTEFEDDGFSIGAPANHRAYSIREGSYLPLEEILVPPEKEYKGNDRFMFYPQSWVLTHYLMSNPDRNKSMLQYFGMLADGDDPLKAAEEAFGDLDELERAVEKYGRGKIEYRRSPQPITIDGTVSVRKLDALESDIVRARFYNRVEYKVERTRNELRELTAANPGNADVYLQLAIAEQNLAHENETFDFTAAITAVDKALELNPQSEKAHIAKARLLLEPDDHPDIVAGETNWEAVRAHAIKANEINAENPRALLTYVESFTRQGGKMPEIAVPAMEQVFGTIPEATNVRVMLAKLHAGSGNFDRALSLVSFLVGDPHNAERGRELVAQIEAMRNGREVSASRASEEASEDAG
ncbi:MAG: hypothetical protein AAFY42_09435 [Pseudomonadota bacterium]